MVLRTDSGVLTMSATRLLCGLNISRQQLRFPAHLFYRLSTVLPLIALRQRATMLIDKTRRRFAADDASSPSIRPPH